MTGPSGTWIRAVIGVIIYLRNWNLGVGISGKSGSLASCCNREEMVHKVTGSEEIGWLWGLCYVHLSLCFGKCEFGIVLLFVLSSSKL